MKQQAMNPYLPLYEYVPDAEPRIFGSRLYVYGSHDQARGTEFCMNDYVVWSAPLNDLSEWTYHGISYSRQEAGDDLQQCGNLAAPDCIQGRDGRYYLYYNCGAKMECEAAVSDVPEGPFHKIGCVAYPDGSTPDLKMFDPGVLIDTDGRIYLFTGFCPTPGSPYIHMAGRYSCGFELEPDMLTIKQGPINILPGCLAAEGTEFAGHGFYEASSPRTINGLYYLVYSSELSHDLCYAVSKQPLSGYHYGGVLVSNADIGFQGNTVPRTPYGNTHGGLVQIKGQWYIFYHRQTYGIECCRQGCAEPIELDDNGIFHQAEITSCGLNGRPLEGSGTYNAAYACNLSDPVHIGNTRLNVRSNVREKQPYICEEPQGSTEQEALHYIANMQNGTAAGFKYFQLKEADQISLTLRSETSGCMHVYLDEACTQPAASVSFEGMAGWQKASAPFHAPAGVFPLFFRLETAGKCDWQDFSFVCRTSSSF